VEREEEEEEEEGEGASSRSLASCAHKRRDGFGMTGKLEGGIELEWEGKLARRKT
jgi:hypothetical protein